MNQKHESKCFIKDINSINASFMKHSSARETALLKRFCVTVYKHAEYLFSFQLPLKKKSDPLVQIIRHDTIPNNVNL